jgi:hypothetical protein
MDWERLRLYSGLRRQRVSQKKGRSKMASPAKVTEKNVDFYGTSVPESVARNCESLIGSSIVASETYVPTSGANKGETLKYEVELSVSTLKDKGFTPDKDADGKDLPATEPFTNLEAKDYAGALALVGGKEEDVWDLFNRSFNMGRRQVVRNRMLAKLEGPQKAINKAVEAFVAMGIPREIAEAKVAELQSLVTE